MTKARFLESLVSENFTIYSLISFWTKIIFTMTLKIYLKTKKKASLLEDLAPFVFLHRNLKNAKFMIVWLSVDRYRIAYLLFRQGLISVMQSDVLA